MNANSDKSSVALMLLTNQEGATTMPIKKCQKRNDLDSFEQLALPHMTLIYRLAYRLSGRKEDAEDLTQETFRIAFEKFDQLREIEKCRNWLVMILKNLFYKELRKKKRFNCVDLDDIAINLAENVDFSDACIKEVSNGEFQQVLNKLDERYKTPLVLSYMDGFSYKEIASILNIPIGTVMSRIARGKVFLKKEFSRKATPLYSKPIEYV